MYHPGSHFAYVGGSEQINNLPDYTVSNQARAKTQRT